jgi:serine O-acetyltransferase
VIGEAAVVGPGAVVCGGVTLGGTGKERGDRHPKVGANVQIGVNATVLGNIALGPGCRVAAAALVLRAVPAGGLAAGSPAAVVGRVDEIGWDL